MRSSDVIEVFNWVGIGTDVGVVDEPIRGVVKDFGAQAMVARIDQRRGPEPRCVPSGANRLLPGLPSRIAACPPPPSILTPGPGRYLTGQARSIRSAEGRS